MRLRMVDTREKKGRLEVWRVLDIESLVDAVDKVHYIIIRFPDFAPHRNSPHGQLAPSKLAP
jgi:hypothetical protein